jgi:hypothetical protein
MEGIKQRKEVEYSIKEKLSISKKLHILSLQIEVKSDDGINTIFENQDKCGSEICKLFKNKSIINCLVYGMTQTGKTGCMTSLIQHYCLSELIPIDNIYIITGLSDKEWKKDTKNRMPDSINSRVFHRANLPKKFFRDITEKKNILVIMDEIQIACKDGQTINKIFKKCGFYDLDFLLENDIKLIQFSATPDGNITDILDWGHHSSKIKLEPGDNYYGVIQALDKDRVKQFKDLTIFDNVKELKNDIEEKYINPKYHIIRVPNKRENKDGTNNQLKVITNLKRVFGEGYEYNKNNLKTQKGDINDILDIKPTKHTFLFICETQRCAKTQIKKHIGVSYERYVLIPDDSNIIQGSFGRLTGYDDNGESICYTNIESLNNYIKLWENDMKFKKDIVWNTKTTQYNKKDNITYSKGTFNSVKHINQLNDGCSEKHNEDMGELIIKTYPSIDALTVILKTRMNMKRGPRNKKPTELGFYEATIKKCTKVWSTEEMGKKPYIGAANNSYWYYPCYTDTSDPNTLQWWLIYYEKSNL